MRMLFTMNIKLLSYLMIILIVLLILSGLFPHVVYAQNKAQHKMLQGVQLFWNAKFNEAIEVLQEAIDLNTLSKDELFSAYLYLGFCFLRSDNQHKVIEQIFRQAVKINPQLKLDSFKIPPDLLNRFKEVRKSMIGSLYITSNPPGAEIVSFSSEKQIEFKGLTPHLFEDLLVGTYDILITKKDYQQEIWRVDIPASNIDTLDIILRLEEKPFYKKWWTWAAGGGVILASIVAMIATKEPTITRPEPSDLPLPPDRPR
jgi:tetratricopeptide (TPR) repeat protein